VEVEQEVEKPEVEQVELVSRDNKQVERRQRQITLKR
jgi:hypothetical protein